MEAWILAVTMTFTAFSSNLESEVHMTMSATYQKPFATKAECEAASHGEKRGMLFHNLKLIARDLNRDLNVSSACLPTQEES